MSLRQNAPKRPQICYFSGKKFAVHNTFSYVTDRIGDRFSNSESQSLSATSTWVPDGSDASLRRLVQCKPASQTSLLRITEKQSSVPLVPIVRPNRIHGRILGPILRPSRLGPPSPMTFTKPSNLQPPAPIWILLHSISTRGQRQVLWQTKKRSEPTQCSHYMSQLNMCWRYLG